jgi:DNA-binding CsgD family transcriptional regulator
MAQTDQLLKTIGAIHGAGLDPQRWPHALETMLQLLGGAAATLEFMERGTFRHHEFHSFGIPSIQELAYLNDYARLNLRLPFHAAAKPGDVLWDHKVLDEEAMNRAPFYAEFLTPIGFRYFLSGVLDADDGEVALVSMQRTRKQGHADRHGIALMEHIVPHVRHACDLARRLRSARAACHCLERALDWLADGVALLRADGSVAYVNEAFQATVRRNDGIELKRNAMDFATAEARRHFEAAIGAVRRQQSGDPQIPVIADFPVLRAGDAPPYLVSVRPLLGDQRVGREAADAIAIVFVRDPLRRHSTALRALREVFGLTETEASVAQALQAGVSLADYARTHAVSLNTVYTHLRRLREKTGCNRMAELIRRLNDLQVPLRLE